MIPQIKKKNFIHVQITEREEKNTCEEKTEGRRIEERKRDRGKENKEGRNERGRIECDKSEQIIAGGGQGKVKSEERKERKERCG